MKTEDVAQFQALLIGHFFGQEPIDLVVRPNVKGTFLLFPRRFRRIRIRVFGAVKAALLRQRAQFYYIGFRFRRVERKKICIPCVSNLEKRK